MVSGVACCLGVDSNDDTLHDQVVAFLGCLILRPSGNLELGNLAVEFLNDLVALCILDGCSQHVFDVLVSLVGNVNRNGAVLANGQGDLIGVYGPGDRIVNAANLYVGNQRVVSCGNGGVLVQLTNVLSCVFKIRGLLYAGILGGSLFGGCIRFGCFGGLLDRGVFSALRILVTSNEKCQGDHQSCCQQKH